jgi:hypothetical protein
VTSSKRDGSAAIATSSGSTDRHTVFHVVPSCRARPWIEACSRRNCPMAHHAARALSSARGAAMLASTSLNEPVGQAGSKHRQVRFRHTNLTARPALGTSTTVTSRRPRARASTPQSRQPIGDGGVSTTTRSPPSPVTSTATTWTPVRPSRRSQRSQ